MPVPKNRAPSVRKIKYRVPSGESRVRFRRRVTGKTHRCALSGEKLTGVHSQRGMAAGKRKPNRPFGGRLTPAMTRRVIIYRARLASGQITLEQVPLAMLPYVKNQAKK
ncbi:Uncharacterised protein [uncultured archaeon]|nr:Uncharacterised protein [uncultured archaeon]